MFGPSLPSASPARLQRGVLAGESTLGTAEVYDTLLQTAGLKETPSLAFPRVGLVAVAL